MQFQLNKISTCCLVLFLFCQQQVFFSQAFMQVYKIDLIKKSQHFLDKDSFSNNVYVHQVQKIYLYKSDEFVFIYDTLIDMNFILDAKSTLPLRKFLPVKAYIEIYDFKNKIIYNNLSGKCYKLDFSFNPQLKKSNLVASKIKFTYSNKNFSVKIRKSNQSTLYPFFDVLFPNYIIEELWSDNLKINLIYSGTPFFYLSKQKIDELAKPLNKINFDACSLTSFKSYILGEQ